MVRIVNNLKSIQNHPQYNNDDNDNAVSAVDLPPDVPRYEDTGLSIWRCLACVAVIIGMLVSQWVTFMVGPLFALMGIYGAVELFWFQPKWEKALKKYQDSLVVLSSREAIQDGLTVGKEAETCAAVSFEKGRCGGTIVSRRKCIHPINDTVSYEVIIEYEYNSSNKTTDDATSNKMESSLSFTENETSIIVRKKFHSVTVPSCQLYHWISPQIDMYVSKDKNRSTSGVPFLVLRHKLQQFRIYDRLILLTMTVLGLSVYVYLAWSFGQFIQPTNDDKYQDPVFLNIGGPINYVIIALGAALLMLIGLCQRMNFDHKQRLYLLQNHDIAMIKSLTNRIQQGWTSLGPTCFHKLSTIVFPFGCFIVIVQGALFGGMMGLIGSALLARLVALLVHATMVHSSNSIVDIHQWKWKIEGITCLVFGVILLRLDFVWTSLVGGVSGIFLQFTCLMLPIPQFYVWMERSFRPQFGSCAHCFHGYDDLPLEEVDSGTAEEMAEDYDPSGVEKGSPRLEYNSRNNDNHSVATTEAMTEY